VGFHIRRTEPPTHPLRPVNPNNACRLCITAAAGTELAAASSSGTIESRRYSRREPFSRMTGVYNPKAFILHAASLCHAFAHCKRFSTAASRRSLGSVSVPVWLTILSDQLPVSLGRPLPYQLADGTQAPPQVAGPEGSLPSDNSPCDEPPHSVLAPLSRSYPKLEGRLPTRYAPLRHFHPTCIATCGDLVRLACLIHAASVRSEPESNSPKQKTTAGPLAQTHYLFNGESNWTHASQIAPASDSKSSA
jgi:hypothetical protein